MPYSAITEAHVSRIAPGCIIRLPGMPRPVALAKVARTRVQDVKGKHAWLVSWPSQTQAGKLDTAQVATAEWEAERWGHSRHPVAEIYDAPDKPTTEAVAESYPVKVALARLEAYKYPSLFVAVVRPYSMKPPHVVDPKAGVDFPDHPANMPDPARWVHLRGMDQMAALQVGALHDKKNPGRDPSQVITMQEFLTHFQG